MFRSRLSKLLLLSLSVSSHDVASWYAKNEKKINNTIAKTVEKFSARE